MSATTLHSRSTPPEQASVNRYFDLESSYWQEVYASSDVQGEVYRDRTVTVLDWIDALPPQPNPRVLEIGCGAGFLSAALAQRHYSVEAIDASSAMVELAQQRAAESGLETSISVSHGDVNALTYEDGTFDIVIAIGVIPWIDAPALAIREMARVVKPGGYVIVTADNRARLTHLLDPRLNPILRPLKHKVRDLLRSSGIYNPTKSDVRASFHSRRFVDDAVTAAGLAKTRHTTIGFGPFTLFGRTLVHEPAGTTIHRRLQNLADRDVPIIRTTGAQYLVLCSRPASL